VPPRENATPSHSIRPRGPCPSQQPYRARSWTPDLHECAGFRGGAGAHWAGSLAWAHWAGSLGLHSLGGPWAHWAGSLGRGSLGLALTGLRLTCRPHSPRSMALAHRSWNKRGGVCRS
jgi:hypothetical protein